MTGTGWTETADADATSEKARALAFQRLAEQHLSQAYRLATAILGSPADSEDATQDAFVAAWRKWESLRDPAAFQPWFDRILVNTCRNRLRQRRPTSVADPPDAFAEPLRGPERAVEARDEVERALARLSPDHRIVIALRFYRDLTVDDIAVRLAIPAGTVKSRLHHALERLESLLAAPDEEADR